MVPRCPLPTTDWENSTFPSRSQPLTYGDPAGQERPEADEDAGLGRTAACGHLAPDPGSGNAGSGWAGRVRPRAPGPGGPRAPLRSSERQSGPTFSAPRKDAWLSRVSGAGSGARLQARVPAPERPGRGGRAHPAPCACLPTPAGGKQQERAPSRLPARREPNFLYLGRGGGLSAEGAPSRVLPGQGRSTEAGPSPSPLRPRQQYGVAGTAGGTEPCSCRRTHPPPLPRAAEHGGGGCQAAERRTPTAVPAEGLEGFPSVSLGAGRAPRPPSLPFPTLCKREPEKDDPLTFSQSSHETPVLQ